MSDSEFQKLEKAEQDVLAQIANQKKVRDDLRVEFRALRDDFVRTYNETFIPLKNSLQDLEGDAWNEHRNRLVNAITNCSVVIGDDTKSEDIGRLQSALKAGTKEALGESDATVSQFEEMSASLRKLEALVQGTGSKDFLKELEARKQMLEKEEETLKSLQDKYDRYFGERRPAGATAPE